MRWQFLNETSHSPALFDRFAFQDRSAFLPLCFGECGDMCKKNIKVFPKTWCKRSVEAENPTKNLREWNIMAERQKLLDGAGKHHINCSTDKSVLRYKTKIEGDPTTELQSLDLRDIELTVSDKRYHSHIREGVNFS